MQTAELSWTSIFFMTATVASVHIWYPWFEKRFKAYESRWVGFTGGIATGYVTLYLLPKLSAITTYLAEGHSGWAFWHLQAYLLLLGGIVTYLTMERVDRETVNYPWLAKLLDHTVHGSYSFLVGYVLVELSDREPVALFLITVIMSLHLLGMNHILCHLKHANFKRHRYLYALAVVAGSMVASLTNFPPIALKLLTSLLAGMIIVNAMSDEMPRGEKGRLRWYLLGVSCFIAAVMVITWLRKEA